ncbi:Cell shape-determining protein MreC precursor [Rickettsiales endosymbiont of Paramecium tredecaurelia]|uniref:rod shape-determining protein MreC n=1 Tax=Candidatus Sarmatiella mevalonica TaxID=2770581 RepID=UPI001922110F|nr:rod shape-determining protein MreC [Candidatus Sarmatiella mevalonica]MBL3284554.1 Cell shape-determining protein MreC precursor [Candidatus Sarmatiella mevalonica]
MAIANNRIKDGSRRYPKIKKIFIFSWVILLILYLAIELTIFRTNFVSSTILEIQSQYNAVLTSIYKSCHHVFTIDYWLDSTLQRENAQLKRKLAITQNYLENLKNIERENVELKKFLALHVNSPTELLINAKVMHTNITRSQHQVIINKGKLDGVKENASVVHNNNLVGIITKSYDAYAIVTLITDPTSKVAIYCSTSHATGILSGAGKEGMHIAYFEGHCMPGEQILTSTRSSLYQPNIKIGVVEHSKLNSLIIKPYFQIDDLHFIQIYK